MFGLRKQIRGDELRIASSGKHYRFGWASGQIDGAITADELLRSGDEAVARAKNFIDSG